MSTRSWKPPAVALLLAAVALSAAVALLLSRAPEPPGPAALPPGQAGPASGAEEAAPAAPASALLTAALPASQGDGTIRGRVTGPAGPVAGAVVVATDEQGEEVLSRLRCPDPAHAQERLLECGCGAAADRLAELIRHRQGEAQPMARSTSGPDGTFELTGLARGASFALWAEKPGSLVGVRGDVATGSEGVEVVLGPGFTVVGRTVTDADRPLPRVAVTGVFAEHARFFDVVSGADGAFSIGPVPPGAVDLVALADPLFPGHARAGPSEPDVGELELLSARTVAGRVLEGGKPVAGAAVQLSGRRATTGADGAFSFGGLRPGDYEVIARSGASLGRAEVLLQSRGDALDVVVRLGPGGEITGVVRASTGSPVEGAEVVASASGVIVGATTARDGSYRVEALPVGRYVVSADGAGLVGAQQDVVVAAGAVATADFTLGDAVAIRGVVVDARGGPVAGASVEARLAGAPRPKDGLDEPAPGTVETAATGEDGAFELDHLPRGRFEITVEHEAFRPLRTSLSSPSAPARLVLVGRPALDGVVLESDGAPVAGASVRLHPLGGQEEPDLPATTDEQGRFRVFAPAEGRYRVEATVLAGLSNRRAKLEVELKAAAPAAAVTLQLPKGLSISGRTEAKGGAPVAKVKVLAFFDPRANSGKAPADDARLAFAVSGADGAFVLDHLCEGSWRLTAQGASATVPAGSTGVTLVVEQRALVRGRVVQESGRPVTSFTVQRHDRSDPDGAFDVPASEALDGTFAFQAEGFATTRRPVDPDARQDVDLGAVVLTRGRTVTGRVVDARTREPVEGARVHAGLSRPTAMGETYPLGSMDFTRVDGGFVLRNVERRPLFVVAEQEGYRTADVPLPPDQDDVTVPMLAGATVVGTLRDAAGQPVAGASVSLSAARFRATEGAEDGTYRFRGVPPGPAVLTASLPGRLPSNPRPLVVPESGEVRADLSEATGGATVRIASAARPMLLCGDVPLPATVSELVGLSMVSFFVRKEPEGYVVRNVPPGTYTVVAMRVERDGGYQVARQRVEVGAEPEQEVMGPQEGSFTRLPPKGPAAP